MKIKGSFKRSLTLLVLGLSVLAFHICLTQRRYYRVLSTKFTNNVSSHVNTEFENYTSYRELEAKLRSNVSEHRDIGATIENDAVNKDRVVYDIYGNRISNTTLLKLPKRQSSCNDCFRHDFRYLIENNVVCKNLPAEENIELLIVVASDPKNFDRRQALRDTWLTQSHNNTGKLRHLFLFGKVHNVSIQNQIVKESKTFGDSLQEDFIDSYANLTYKTIMGFKWAATKCPSAKFIFKTDDDMFINIPALLKVAKSNSERLETHIVGACKSQTKPNRNKKSKWYTSIESFPGKIFDSGYCPGTGYLTSLNVARKIYEVSPNVPFFHLEDVYVAICVQRLGYKLRDIPGFRLKLNAKVTLCDKAQKAVTSHNISAIAMRTIWNAKCP